MNKDKLIIASLDNSEAITNVVTNNKVEFDIDIDVIYINDMLSNYNIYDEVNDDETIIRWYDDKGRIISNKTHLLLNRVLYLPDSMFLKYSNNDRSYAKREFIAYLGFSFNAFEGVGNSTSYGMCIESLSLPQQWNLLSQAGNINVPKYYWGPKKQNNLNSNIVYSDIYNFINWKIINITDSAAHSFSFEKPKGEPVFVFSIGNKSLVKNEHNITSRILNRIFKLVQMVKENMDFFISETLLFIDGDKITFGCVNSEIIQAIKNPCFEEFVCNNLIEEYRKCISLRHL